MHLVRQVAAGLLAALALVLALRPGPADPAAPARPAEVEVVVAAVDLAAGAVLGAGDLTLVTLPPAAVPDGVVFDVGQVTGEVLAGPLRRGEPVTDVRVVGPGLWSQVPAGQVAAPVRLADLAVATLLRAGDRVDVLAAASDGQTPSVEVVAESALVLTVPTTAEADPPLGAADGTGLLVLAVAPETAQRLAAAGAGATLTVTLGRP